MTIRKITTPNWESPQNPKGHISNYVFKNAFKLKFPKSETCPIMSCYEAIRLL